MAFTDPKTWVSEKMVKEDLNTYVRDNQIALKANVAWGVATELTIAAGSITKTQSYHKIDTQGDATTDNLDTIAGGSEGDIIVIRCVSAARVVIVKNGTGNIELTDDVTLDDVGEMLTLIYDGSNWQALNYPVSDVSPLPFCVTNAGSFTGYCKTFND